MTKRIRSPDGDDYHLGNMDQSTGGAPVVLEPDVFDRFMESCQQDDAPNPALKRAANLAKERGIGSQKADLSQK